jgi:outer membrane protein OmpA-like peptidoglycan-associated protein
MEGPASTQRPGGVAHAMPAGLRTTMAIGLLVVGVGDLAVIHASLLPRYLASRSRGSSHTLSTIPPQSREPPKTAALPPPSPSPEPQPVLAAAATVHEPSEAPPAASPSASLAELPPAPAATPPMPAELPPAPAATPNPPGSSAPPAVTAVVPEPVLAVRAPPPTAPAPEEPAEHTRELAASAEEPAWPHLSFARNTAWLSPDSREILGRLADRLKASSELTVVLSGHTDDLGTPELNHALSLDRALRAQGWLIGRGVDAKQIEIHSYGAKMPVATGLSSEARAQNRRVEIALRERSR